MMMRQYHCALLVVLLLAGFAQAQVKSWTAIPVGRADYQIWNGDCQLFNLKTKVIGPNWTNARPTALSRVVDGRRVYEETVGFAPGRGQTSSESQEIEFAFHFEASEKPANSFRLITRTTTNRDTEAIGVGLIVSTTDFFAGGEGTVRLANGSLGTFSMPLGMGQHGDAVEEIVLTAVSGEQVVFSFSRPLKVTSDRGELRIWYWSDEISAENQEESEITVSFPGPIAFEAANRIVDASDWIKFHARQDFSPGSPIGVEDWLDAPAGKHGWVQMDGQHFVFQEQMKPFKFWGTNIAYSRMAVSPELAEEWASKFAKYGVNIVRYHKWTGNNGWNGVMSQEDVLEFDEDACRRFDNIHAEMKRRGIYAGWSPIFTLKLHESMAKYLDHYDEIQAAASKRNGMFANSLYPLSTFAPDVQDLYIAMMVKWLERTNTVTGLRYADDPAVAYVELHNEADIFFHGTDKLVKLYPSYEKHMNERFAGWLAKKYKDDAGLADAWGSGLKRGESIADKNIFPFQSFRGPMPAPQHIVDRYTFLYEYQNEFYDRYVEAIRQTGYRGAIVSGCWQASDMYGHLLNIASDRRAGFIDRHNYFKGERPMLTAPGSALLSAGMQQVGDRPFGLTEWAGGHVWGAECQPVLGLIGLGLNGWDYSAQFASSSSIVLPDNNGQINGNFDELRATGQHPFIARFLYSGALKEGANVGSRRISMEELYAGNVGFEERFSLLGGANLKTFEGSVPNEALGAGRVTIDIVDKPVEPKVEMSNLDKYWDREKNVIRASNGQIVWDYRGRGFFTVDTPAAAAVIGFGGGRNHELTDVSVQYDNPFANIYLAARRQGQTLADANQVVIMTLARTANQGDILEETEMAPLVRGQRDSRARTPEDKRADYLANPRLLVEPVKANITLTRQDSCRVYALDHDGCKPATAREIRVESTSDGVRFTLDGHQTRTLYYLVEFAN